MLDFILGRASWVDIYAGRGTPFGHVVGEIILAVARITPKRSLFSHRLNYASFLHESKNGICDFSSKSGARIAPRRPHRVWIPT